MSFPSGYVDLQVNGYAGVDFNADEFDVSEVLRICRRLREEGVAAILATIISDDISSMCRRLRNVVLAYHADSVISDLVRGIHIEGPFLSDRDGYVGTHPRSAMKDATIGEMEKLLESAGGLTRLVTLAPERDRDCRVIRHLADRGICVSAGHCDASLNELQRAIDAGLTMFTHLGNGCPRYLDRHDNIIQRVLSVRKQLWIGFIADGVHVPFPALGNYLQLVGIDRAFVVTDAMQAAGNGPGMYRLAGQTVVVDESGATWSRDRSHLMGSAATMPQMHANLVGQLKLSETDVLKLTSLNPRSAVGMT